MNDMNIPQAEREVKPEDNFKLELDALAAQAREKIEDWRRGDTTEQAGKTAKKLAVIEYGKLLKTGRDKLVSNNAYGQWVRDNKLDAPPYQNSEERSCAIRVAELVLSSTTQDAFANCPFTNPTNMITWARDTGLIKPTPKPEPPPQPTPKPQPAPVTQRVTEPSPQPAQEQPKAEEPKRQSAQGYIKQREREQKIERGEAVPSKTLNKLDKQYVKDTAASTTAQVAKEENLPETAKDKLERVVRTTVERLAQEFRIMQEEFKIRTRKELSDRFDKLLEERVPKHRQEVEEAYVIRMRYQELISSHKHIFLPEEYKQIVMVLHPDNSAGKETREAAFRIFNAQKFRLTGVK